MNIKYAIVFFMLPVCIFAEDIVAENESDEIIGTLTPQNVTETIPNILLHQNSIMFFPFNYQLLDGTPKVDSNKLRQILRTAPGNEKLLKQEKGLRIMAYVFGTICMASTAAHLGYLFSDYPDRNAMMTAFYVGETVGLGLTFFTGMAANNKISRAVDNYNLSIMGIPIPTGKKR
jgi:hypothetical protein